MQKLPYFILLFSTLLFSCEKERGYIEPAPKPDPWHIFKPHYMKLDISVNGKTAVQDSGGYTRPQDVKLYSCENRWDKTGNFHYWEKGETGYYLRLKRDWCGMENYESPDDTLTYMDIAYIELKEGDRDTLRMTTYYSSGLEEYRTAYFFNSERCGYSLQPWRVLMIKK